ncbi:hypothetical protein [Calycomorphotria hydatis]|uniref:hypothetical protein n=1 Tax=Calycomorphotria hydatis TaxID=2528027 RepID=UPI0018D23B11|nr:hypothetical protein [Calycomorphotria hydatis]
MAKKPACHLEQRLVLATGRAIMIMGTISFVSETAPGGAVVGKQPPRVCEALLQVQ